MTRGGSTITLALALAAALASCGGHGGGGGKATPDELVAAALDRATAGDVDGVVALSSSAIADSIADCRSEEAATAWKTALQQARADFAKSLAPWKGASVKIVSVAPAGSADVTRAGASLRACVATTDITSQDLDVKVTAHTASRPEDDSGTITMTAIRVHDQWYLDAIHGRPPDHLRGLRNLRDEACECKDVACATRVAQRLLDHLRYLEQQRPQDDKRVALKAEIDACFAKLGVKLNAAP